MGSSEALRSRIKVLESVCAKLQRATIHKTPCKAEGVGMRTQSEARAAFLSFLLFHHPNVVIRLMSKMFRSGTPNVKSGSILKSFQMALKPQNLNVQQHSKLVQDDDAHR